MEVYPDYLLRTFSVQLGTETRVVRHFHYIAWPDHGVPGSTMTAITILRRAKSMRAPDAYVDNCVDIITLCWLFFNRNGKFTN